MYTKKISYGDSALAGKRPSGGPAKLRGCIGARCTPLGRCLRVFFDSFVDDELAWTRNERAP